MADVNPYEEARKQRLDENRRRFQDLGVDKIVKSLTPVAKPKLKAKPKSTTATPVDPDLVRRSSRPRSVATSYAEEFIKELPLRKKLRSGTSTRLKSERPMKKLLLQHRELMLLSVRKISELNHVPSSHPSYVKSMLQSHVYHGFWLNVPTDFCQKHLSEDKITIVLEDKDGVEYDTIYIGEKTGLSGGWKAFAKDHKLDDGDALVFELIKPTRLKVHIFKGIDGVVEGNVKKPKTAKGSKPIKKVKKSDPEEDMVERGC
ncbi:hypothetical protein MKW92_029393 [Papaver armeniacum]|nr:hypothetical protein MKW92_029393 [Papaver armeniacum]